GRDRLGDGQPPRRPAEHRRHLRRLRAGDLGDRNTTAKRTDRDGMHPSRSVQALVKETVMARSMQSTTRAITGTELTTTQLGKTGLEITRVGFGAWAIGGG